MNTLTKTANLLLILMLLSGCSSLGKLDIESTIATGVLAYAAASELSDGELDNNGTTHLVASYGASKAVADFADSAFPHPDQEWIADSIAIAGAAIPASYYYDREDGDTQDSRLDWQLPLGNLLWTVYKRLSRIQ